MAAITSPVIKQLSPNCGLKEIVVRCSMATGETFAAGDYFSTIVSSYLNDDTGVVKVATWSGTTVTIGTVSTGVHCLRLLGF